MRGKQLWGALLATCSVLIPGLAFGQDSIMPFGPVDGGLPFGQTGENYAPPDTNLPLPLFSTHPEAGGLFVAGGVLFERQTNPIKNQQVAVRGFAATSDNVLGISGTAGQFIGTAQPALNVRQVSGPNSYQPGFSSEIGWKFGDGQAITFTYRRLTEAQYSATATLFPQNFQVGPQFQNTFLTAFVFNFPNQFAGPQFKVTGAGSPLAQTLAQQVQQQLISNPNLVIPIGAIPIDGGANGIWNGAATMEISFIQRFTDYFVTYRVPVIDTECYRMSGLAGPRATWIWERFKWRTVDLDTDGVSTPQDVAVYTDIVSNYMYGVFIGCEQEWYWGHGVAGMLDTRATAYLDVVKERAKYQLGDREFLFSVANKRARRDWKFVPEVEATLGLMWYPIEGVQIKVGYNVMAFFNTISAPRPISFNYSSLDPAYESTFRFFDGFQAAISLTF